MKVLDLFSGCGGLSLGFIQAGFNVSKAVEFDSSIANTYKMNHSSVEMIVDDISRLVQKNIFTYGEADIIIGGPPCQGFSMAGARIREGFIDDPRNYLFKQYFNVVKEIKPDIFVMENVKGITTIQHGEIFNSILRIFSDSESLGGISYDVHYKIIKAIDFGVPQKRERMVIIGTLKKDLNLDRIMERTKAEISAQSPHYFDKVTVRDAIGNLPEVSESGNVRNPKPQTNYQRYLSVESDVLTNHNRTNHSDIAVSRMSQVANGANFTSLNEKINSVHSGSYGRLCWDEPAATITTRFDTPAGGRFTHPEENRTLSPREAARIQSFPDSFIFYGNRTSVCKQIGNAVPPKVSYFLARLVKNILDSEG